MKVLAVTFALAAGLLFVPRTFGSTVVYLAQADTFEISNQTGDDTSNETVPPEVHDTNS